MAHSRDGNASVPRHERGSHSGRLAQARMVEHTGAETCLLLTWQLVQLWTKTPTAKTTEPTFVQQDCYYSSSERPKDKKMY